MCVKWYALGIFQTRVGPGNFQGGKESQYSLAVTLLPGRKEARSNTTCTRNLTKPP